MAKVAVTVGQHEFKVEAEGRILGPFPFSDVEDVWCVHYGDELLRPLSRRILDYPDG